MKTLKSVLLPAVIVIAGVSAAFATSPEKSSETVLENGFYFDSTAPTIKCIETDVQCNPTGSSLCTWIDANNVSHNLQRKVSNTACGMNLYRVN
ncbi:DUF6520 family protein [Flavobacterium sp. RNTU_13]|jgi:hypothetical protein|uniref:DUF6520 family protein n=1 Tax=Flavobacterium sp. RNTU_13 TaxID=3375145 RepID=UPI003985EDF0